MARPGALTGHADHMAHRVPLFAGFVPVLLGMPGSTHTHRPANLPCRRATEFVMKRLLSNGPVLRVSGNSVVNVSGAFVNFGGTGSNRINVTNTLCSSSCTSIGGMPVFLLGGASSSQVSIGANAIRNPTLGQIVRSNSSLTAVIVVDSPSSRVTITAP